jgi:oxygen-independent coproporphyrinogen-3 oxidase
MHAIMIQLKEEFKRFDVKKNAIQTLFIGGGTPSCVESLLYQPFFDFVTPYLAKDAEITTEANPNSATKDWLKGMFNLGVNRVSFGVQSFDSQKLQALNRNHTPTQAKEAVKNASKIGFKNISLDLIYGTAFDSKSLLKEDLKQAFDLPINHLSAYSLTIEEGTKFFETPTVAKDEESLAFWFIKEIEKKGLSQYEISNFGTYQSKHNLGYWQYQDYIGVGSGAVGFLTNCRFYTQTDVHQYIQKPNTIMIEKLTHTDIKHEKILLGLRSNVGFSKEIIDEAEVEKAMHLVEAGKLIYHDRRFLNPDFFLADELTLYITS